jgi:hypothetical protein
MLNRCGAAIILFLTASLLVVPTSAYAQDELQKGAKAGVGGGPGQAWLGAHIDLKYVRDRLLFRPGADIGFGNGSILTSVNGDVVHLFRDRSEEWVPFVGGGPALVVQSFRAGEGDSSVGAGFNFIGGIKERRGLLIEVRLGAWDSPRFRAGIGWTW